MSLTPKQKEILDFISRSLTKRGFAPTQQEIAQHFKFSSLGTVQNYLVRLERDGFLKKIWNGKRSLSVQPPKGLGPLAKSLRLVGRVAAGQPIEAIETEGTLEVPASMLRSGDYFVLEVVGSSMIEDGILHGDYLIVRKQRSAEEGQTVVALIDDGATVKRFHKKKGAIELHPANPAFQPIRVTPDRSFQIEGIVAGVIRKSR